MQTNEILKHVDHTLLLQGATWEEIRVCTGKSSHLYRYRIPERLYDHSYQSI